jgi:hypothetical protein
MDKVVFVKLSPATAKGRKYKMIFFDKDKKKIATRQFGQAGASDFTKHGDTKRRDLYDQRHKAREDWNAPMTKGALSKWILWNKPTLEASFKDYKKRFKFKKLV